MQDKYKILIIDDEKGIREILTRLLERVGYNVLAVEDGISALTEIKRFNPELIFLDIMMPGMNGLQFLEKLVPLNEKPFKVIILSAYADKETIEFCNDIGVYSIINKPFEVRDIVRIARENFVH